MEPEEYHKRITSYIKNPNDSQEVKQKIEEFKAISTYVSGAYDATRYLIQKGHRRIAFIQGSMKYRLSSL